MEQSRAKPWVMMDTLILAVSIMMVLYHLVSAQIVLMSTAEHSNVHLAFALTLIYLNFMRHSERRWQRPLILALILLSLAATVYMQVSYEDMLWRQGFPLVPDVVAGVILIVVVVEASRRAFGLTLPLLVLAFLAYAGLGFLLPQPLTVMQYSFAKLVAKFSMYTGLYSNILETSANYIFLFVIFGSLLQLSGATTFFIQAGRLFGRGLAGGAALTAVVSSALIGTTTGSVAPNILTSGAYTIPLMKQVGYKPEQAAAIEAASSTGGQIMPPVLGAAAFVMAGMTGIPYFQIAMAAAIPAVLYFFGVGVYAQLQATKLGISPMSERVDTRELWRTAHLFLVPIGLIVFLLARDYSPIFAIFWTIVATFVLTLLNRRDFPSWRTWGETINDGVRSGAQIGVVTALVGIVVTSLSLTGLGLKLPGLIETISGGNLLVMLVLTAAVAIILGCGMPTVAVYTLVSVVVARVLVQGGLPVFTAHFFTFSFAIMNFVTPPVALGAAIAAKMAGARYIPTSVESTKAALAGFLVPFLFILSPVLILRPQGSLLLSAMELVSSFGVIVMLQVAILNCYLRELTVTERVAMAAGCLLTALFLVTKNYAFLAGFIPFIGVTVTQVRKQRLKSAVAHAE